MQKFIDYYTETVHKHNLGSLTVFDIDDTLFHTRQSSFCLKKGCGSRQLM